jgi:hypothetical protein
MVEFGISRHESEAALRLSELINSLAFQGSIYWLDITYDAWIKRTVIILFINAWGNSTEVSYQIGEGVVLIQQ